MFPKLYTDVGNPQTLKLVIAARLSNKDLQIIFTDDEVVPYLTRKQLPALQLIKTDFLFSTNAAARFLLSADVGDTIVETQIDTWLEWESTKLQILTNNMLVLSSGTGKEEKSTCLSDLKTLLKYIDNKLDENDNTLVKGQITTADVIVWSTLYPILGNKTFLKGWETEYSRVYDWFQNLLVRKEFQDGVNQVTDGKGISAFKATGPVPKSQATGVSVKTKKDSEKASKKEKKDEKPDVKNNSFVPSKVSASDADQEQMAEVIVTDEEISIAVSSWHNSHPVTKTKRLHPILPKPGARNMLITSALPYVNNVPHLGNIVGSTLSGDVFSRYCRLRGYNSLYICGTDEYGTATETKALEEGLTPQQICDKYNKIHREIYDWFQISFDYFGRTTTPQQTEIAQSIFWKLHQNGFISENTVDQLKCEKCDKFLADRFVEGVCPLCSFEDARGDQCDKCGKLINAVELVKPRCKTCLNTPILKSSRHLFLDLPELESNLSTHLEKVFPGGIWTNNAKVITNSWLRDGLKPRCISRDLKWGTPVPLDGFTDKVFYVWFDAPIGYMSITANYTDKWENWWRNPEQVKMYNFLGKDNVPFHSVIFPCTLLGTKENYTVVDSVVATEYLNYEDGKFSKSRGIGVFGDNAKETGIPADIFRFYLLYVRPESQDTAFSWDDFQLKNNSELLNNIGNFINRALTFVSNSFEQTIQPMKLDKGDEVLIAQVNKQLHCYINNMENAKMRDSIRNLLSISRLGNQYMQANKPWVLVKGTPEEKSRAGTIVSLSANIAALLSVLLEPFMPTTSRTIKAQLNIADETFVILDNIATYVKAGHKIGKPSPLFQKLETSLIQELKKKFMSESVKEKSKSPPPTSSPQVGSSDVEIEKLNQMVTEQGLKVRELKTNKAEKSVVDAEVAILIELKRTLAVKQGIDPSTLIGGGKKKGKKK